MQYFDYPDGSNTSETRQLTVLNGLVQEDWNIIAKYSQKILYKSGDKIVDVGETDDGVYIIVEGSVEVIIRGAFGIEKSITEIYEGSVFGELSFFDKQPRSAAVKAKTDGYALHLSRQGFEQLSAWDPALGRKLLFDLGKIIAYRFRLLTKDVV